MNQEWKVDMGEGDSVEAHTFGFGRGGRGEEIAMAAAA